jgi:hypothetical protein
MLVNDDPWLDVRVPRASLDLAARQQVIADEHRVCVAKTALSSR